MSKHDTWVYLKPDSPFAPILPLFPDGIPMRDPFPLEKVTTPTGEQIPLYITDFERMSDFQIQQVAELIAFSFGVEVDAVIRDASHNGGFGIAFQHIERMQCGPEGMQRSKELADFLEIALPPSKEAFEEFYHSQYERWINGNQQPKPLPERIEDWDSRLQSPELEEALKKQQINKMLAGYSVFDVLSGRAMIEILNQLDPDNEYGLVGYEDEDFYE